MKEMTSDTFKKIGSENFDDGSPTMTAYIDVDPLFYMIQQIIENHSGMISENELEDIVVNKNGWLKDHRSFQKEIKRIIEKSNQTDGNIRQYYAID